MTKRQTDHRSLASHGQEAAGLGRRHDGKVVEHCLDCRRIVGINDAEAAAVIAEPGHDRFGQGNLAGQGVAFLAIGRARQHANLDRPIGEGHGEEIEANLGHLVDRKGQHVGRQTGLLERYATPWVGPHHKILLVAAGPKSCPSTQWFAAFRQTTPGCI